MKCENCSHAEMCKWIDELEGRGCDFFDGEQEPSEDDGVDHEKIRKAFAKESDIKKADIADMIPKVIMQAEEETDRFIFQTIRPYCEEITQQEISKEILSKALIEFFDKQRITIDAVISWLKDKDIIKLSGQEERARKELQALIEGETE